MNQTETVAVVMCTYNGASRHLAEQLDSLFAQTLKPKEKQKVHAVFIMPELIEDTEVKK